MTLVDFHGMNVSGGTWDGDRKTREMDGYFRDG